MAPRKIDGDERRRRLVRRHRHVPSARTDDVVAIADGLGALHSTDPVTVYLSVAARMVTPALEPVSAALYDERSLIRHHAMRRTLWVFGHAAAGLAHHGATLGVHAVQRRSLVAALAEADFPDPADWIDRSAEDVLALLAEAGPLTAREIGARLPHLAVPVEVGGGAYAVTQSAHTRLLLLMGFAGQIVRARPTGTWINGAYRYAAASSWFPGGFDLRDARESAAGLARLYLRAFGPVTAVDLKWWAGWTVATTKRALADLGAVEVAVDSGPAWVLPDDVAPEPPVEPSALLLPGLDPSTMGWKERGFHLPTSLAPRVFDRNGNGGPAAWVDGRVVGGWAQRKDGTIALRLLTDVGASATAALEEHAHDLETLLGDVRFTARYPAPLTTELLA